MYISKTMETDMYNPSRCAGTTRRGLQCKRRGRYTNKGKSGLYCGLHVEKESETCVICLRNLYDTCTLQCGHGFHTQCIMQWFRYQNTCPVCRHVVVDGEEMDESMSMGELTEVYIRVEIEYNSP